MQTMDSYCYSCEHTIEILINGKLQRRDFFIHITHNPAQNPDIKLWMVNSLSNAEFYTSLITAEEFQQMKYNQRLLVEFGDFCNQIMTLLEQNRFCIDQVHLRLEVERPEQKVLHIYKASNLKELTLLKLPLFNTAKDEIINYVSNRLHKENVMIKDLVIINNDLVSKINQFNNKKMLATTAINIQRRQIDDLNKANEKLFSERASFEGKIKNLLEEKNLLLINYNTAKAAEKDLNQRHKQLTADVSVMRQGILHYTKKSEQLTATLAQLESSVISKNSYNRLQDMFSQAVSDITKYKTMLEHVLHLHEVQKVENLSLKSELENCIHKIDDLKTGFTRNLGKKTDADMEDEKMLENLIKKVEVAFSLQESNK